MNDWLKEEGSLSATDISTGALKMRSEGEAGSKHNLAVFLKPLVVLNTQKWFGEAELRLDALVVHGGSEGALYHPQTFRFPRVVDRDDLAGTENGLLVYLGKPAHFIGISLMLARDSTDSADLAQLLAAGAASKEFTDATSALSALALPSPHAAALQAGLGAALALGDFAYKLVRQISPSCLGLYRASWLAGKDRFGVGRHPRQGAHRVKDFEVGYEVLVQRN